MMNRYLQSALVAALGVSATCALAQQAPPATSPPPSSTASPADTPSASSADGSFTSANPQRQASAESRKEQQQAMKDCVAKEQSNGTGVTEKQAKKTCKAQMKANSAAPQAR